MKNPPEPKDTPDQGVALSFAISILVPVLLGILFLNDRHFPPAIKHGIDSYGVFVAPLVAAVLASISIRGLGWKALTFLVVGLASLVLCIVAAVGISCGQGRGCL